MQIKRRRACGTERSGDFASNDPALAHARYHHAATAGIQAFHSAFKVLRHRPVNAFGQFAQRFRLNADYVGTS